MSEEIEVVHPAKVELEAVFSIYRQHKKELGFLPDSGFIERWAKKHLLVVKIGGVIAGYVLFSVNRRREVRIAHLAVDVAHQGRRLSSFLIDRLKKDYADHARIRLNCRADYRAAKIWPRLGFVAFSRKPAKKEGNELVQYQCRLNDMPLFDFKEATAAVPLVVVDANICIDIHCEDRDQHEASSGLRADWLADQISLAVTEEIYNDFDRQEESLRERMKAAVRNEWELVRPVSSIVDPIQAKIRAIMGAPRNDSDASDQRHLAIAAAAQASVFVTRDRLLLEKGAEIFSELGLRVQQSSEVIQEIDSVLRAEQYQFRELQNTGIEKRRLTSVKDLQLDQFIRYPLGEKESQLAAFINEGLALPMRYEVFYLRNDESSLALIVIENRGDHVRSLLRVQMARKLAGTTLENILAELIASQPLGNRFETKPIVIELRDPAIAPV